MGELLVAGFVVQQCFIECFNLLIQMLDALEQLRSQAAQLFRVELSERRGRNHSLILPKMLIGVCQTLPLKQTDCSVRPKSLPRQTDHQRLKLFGIEFQLRIVPSIWPDKSALMQAACGQPDTQTVAHQYFQEPLP